MAAITFLKENRKIDDALSIYGAVVKIRNKSYAISFESLRYYEGDNIAFSPKNLVFLESKVRPTSNMILEASQAICNFRVDYKYL